MRVAELTAFLVRIPLKKPIRHASHARSETENVVVRCRLAGGTVGFGEGVPRDYVTGETAESALGLLQKSDLRSQLEDAPNWPAALLMVERLALAPVPGDDRQCGGNAARCALELALLDAYGKHFGRPLSDVTGLLAPELNDPRPAVRYSGAITSAKGFKARLAGWKMRLYGFRHVKVKVGIAGYDDVARLKSIRRSLGGKVAVRIDANEAWPVSEAVRRIRELEPFRLQAVEQPLAHEDCHALADLRSRVHTPIMLDESLCSMVDADRAVAGGWCDLFNLRLSKCGGFVRTLRLAQRARQAGLGYQIGCQVGETALLSAAGRHLAATLKGPVAVEGSYDRHLVRESLGTRDITFGYGGKAPALAGPGLGVEVNLEALARVTFREAALLQDAAGLLG